MDGLFKVSGRFKDSAGKPIANLLVILFDEDDFDADDLIGAGAVGSDGGFRMTFARGEFEQDTLEYEETPDLKVVAALVGDQAMKPVFARAFEDLKWERGEADLGDLIIENFNPDKPVYLEGVKLPDADRYVTRLEITDAMLQECFAEIVPLVERHTGWKDLARGLKVQGMDSLAPIILRDVLEQKGAADGSFEALIYQTLADHGGGFAAAGGLYDPPTDTIYINRSSMQQNGIEFLKVILAHELVHAGQFRNTPGLAAYARDYQRRMVGLAGATTSGPSLLERRQFMVEVEGYATYIERDFIRKHHYRMALADVHTSLLESASLVFAWLASLGLGISLPEPPPEATIEDKLKQYEEGVTLYRSRAKGDQPARWEVTVASLPGGAAFAPT